MEPLSLDSILSDPNLIKVVQIAPAVRVAIGEPFGSPPGTVLTPPLITALRQIGFDFVFETNFAADVVVMEENKELEDRALRAAGPLPLLNSCCPGFATYLERGFPDLFHKHMATTKSPMEVMGTLIKTYFAQKNGFSPKKICSVALMPCMIKKLEAKRPDLLLPDGSTAVDMVITTAELGEYLKKHSIDLPHCPPGQFDALMGESSASARLFGTTGGVSEATLRYHAQLHGQRLGEPQVRQLRGFENTRELVFEIAGKPIKILLIHGLANAGFILKDPAVYKQYHFIEVMTCPGGCIGGSGQPKSTPDIIQKRREGLYTIFKAGGAPQSGENLAVRALYHDFLGEVGGEKAHALLHVHRAEPKT